MKARTPIGRPDGRPHALHALPGPRRHLSVLGGLFLRLASAAPYPVHEPEHHRL